MDGFQTVIYEKRQGIAWLTLNRPRMLNAMNMAMRDELWTVMEAVRDDPDAGVLIIKGAGERAFSSGADISEFGTSPSYIEARRARRERDLWQLMLDLDKPLIAAIQGFALGAGCEMSMCCDLRIASEDARFGLPEVGLGYIPSAGGTQLLPRTVPPGVAMEMILSGEHHRCPRGAASGAGSQRGAERAAVRGGGGAGAPFAGSFARCLALCQGGGHERERDAPGRGVGDGGAAGGPDACFPGRSSRPAALSREADNRFSIGGDN